ncbi:MAG: hypothetical protein KAI47_23950, partial [Deltaproteobacteria bacterium]|nr:hypothetical protein [Deltaproteobacteria bacterium]
LRGDLRGDLRHDFADQAVFVDLPVSVDQGATDATTLEVKNDVKIDGTGGQAFGTLWDLTKCPLELRATIDFSQLTAAGDPDNVSLQVGLREVGRANHWPSDFGGWIMARPSGFMVTDPAAQELDDKLILQARQFEDEKAYDIDPSGQLVAPFGTFENHGCWFDRDGIDPASSTCAALPPAAKAFYCTGGLYPVVITYRSLGPTKGAMMATVNGMAQGFNTGGQWKATPDISPSGKSFTGDLKQLQLFVGLDLTGAGTVTGSITVRSIELRGCKAL